MAATEELLLTLEKYTIEVKTFMFAKSICEYIHLYRYIIAVADLTVNMTIVVTRYSRENYIVSTSLLSFS